MSNPEGPALEVLQCQLRQVRATAAALQIRLTETWTVERRLIRQILECQVSANQDQQTS